MQTLGVLEISRIGREVHPDKQLHSTTIAMIRSLLEPYAVAMEPAPLDAVYNWLPQVFPVELAAYARSTADTEQNRLITTSLTVPSQLDLEHIAKNAIIEYFVAELLELGGNEASNKGSNIIIPWDVLKAIVKDLEFRTLFQYPENTTTLSVSAIINGQQVTYPMSRDLAAGIFLVSNAFNVNFQMTMFGLELSSDMFPPVDEETAANFIFNVDVTINTYGFDTPEFMQGIVTGTDWINLQNQSMVNQSIVNHHLFWSNLVQLTVVEGDEEVHETQLTF